MRKILLIIVTAFLFSMCGSSKTAGTKAPAKAEVQYRDDFTAAPESQKKALLNTLKATGANYSVLIFTKAYKGEQITVTASGKTLYRGNLISNLKTGIAEKIRINNTTDTKVSDNFTKKEVIIEAAEAQKHKFIYLMKTAGSDNQFTVTYSNTLRPLN
jgi:hypothetical protein